MGDRYWVGGNANWDATAGTKWATSSGGTGGAAVPTAADDVYLDNGAGTGNVSVTAPAVCRSLNCTGYTGTLTQGTSITIGDATAGAGSIALKFVSGMTYTASGNTINFVSTSATVQTIDFAGKGGTGLVTFNASSNGSWQYVGAHTTTAGTVTLTKGTLDLNSRTDITWTNFNSANTNVRRLILGSAAITINGASATSWNVATITNLTVDANTATLTFTGINNAFSSGTFNWNGLSIVASATGDFQIGGSPTINSLTRAGTAGKTNTLSLTGSPTLTTFAVSGNSTINRILVYSTTYGTARTITASTVTVSNIDFRDITGAGAGDWNLSVITGLSGDCGGNSGITFTTAATQTSTGTASFTWSTHGWTSRVPLPQDDVSVPNSFVAGRTITADMPRLGKNITFTCTGSPALTVGQASELYGSLTLIATLGAVTIGGNLSFVGAAAATLTSAGKSFGGIGYAVVVVRSKLTLGDAFSCVGSLVTSGAGYIDTANYAVTCMYPSFLNTSNVNLLGTSVITVTAISSYVFQALTGNISAASAELVISVASASSRLLTMQINTLGTLTYTVAASAGALTFDFYSPTTITTLNVGSGRSITFTSGAIYNITNWNVFGAAGSLVTITATTPGTFFTLSKSSGIVTSDYLSVKDSIATGGASFYAGSHSVNVSGNTGWIFTDPQSLYPKSIVMM